MRLLKSEGVFSFILPSGWFGASQAGALRQFLTYKTRPIDVVILPWDVFDDCWVDTALLAGAKRTNEISDARSATDAIRICVFPKKHGTVTAREISQGGWRLSIADWTAAATGEWLVAASPEALVVLKKIEETDQRLGNIADVQRGVTPFPTTPTPSSTTDARALVGTLRRYKCETDRLEYIALDDNIAEPKPDRYFRGPRVLLRELIKPLMLKTTSSPTNQFNRFSQRTVNRNA